MIKIKEYKTRQYGKRGSTITIPAIYTEDNQILPGDTMEIYRDNLPEGDAIIILPKNKTVPKTESNLTPAA